MQFNDGVIRTKCPKCGGEIRVTFLYQYTKEFPLKKNGELSKKYRRYDNGPIDAALAFCVNCNADWDGDEFIINEDDKFVDYKY